MDRTIRSLIKQENKSASEVSHKNEIFESESDLLSIAGGKLTGYRKMVTHKFDKKEKQLIDNVIKKATVFVD